MGRTVTGPSYDVILTGRGGQGVIFLSRVMGQAALLQRLGVRTTETHGMAMRGGSVQCFVRVGNVAGPLMEKGSGRLLMALHPDEVAAGLPLLAGDGTVVVNGQAGLSASLAAGDRRVLVVDADGIASGAGNHRSANLALLGAAAARVHGFPLERGFIEEAVSSGPARSVQQNLEVFRRGLAWEP